MAQSVLGKINYLTEEQYQDAKAKGQINENEIYMTPDKTKIQDVRLFYDANGYMSNIQLGVNKSKFKKLRIIYASNGGDYRCVEIPTVSSNFCLYGVDNNGNGTAAWMKKTTYALTENAITIQNAFWKNVNGNEYGTDNCIKIIEVLGITDDEIFIPKLNSPTHHIDKNGWVVFDHGTYKEYIKYVTFTVSVNASAWGTMIISNLPEGISLLGNRFLSGTCACKDAAIDLDIISYPDWGTINVTYRNNYGAALSQPGQAYLRILEIPELL